MSVLGAWYKACLALSFQLSVGRKGGAGVRGVLPGTLHLDTIKTRRGGAVCNLNHLVWLFPGLLEEAAYRVLNQEDTHTRAHSHSPAPSPFTGILLPPFSLLQKHSQQMVTHNQPRGGELMQCEQYPCTCAYHAHMQVFPPKIFRCLHTAMGRT